MSQVSDLISMPICYPDTKKSSKQTFAQTDIRNFEVKTKVVASKVDSDSSESETEDEEENERSLVCTDSDESEFKDEDDSGDEYNPMEDDILQMRYQKIMGYIFVAQ